MPPGYRITVSRSRIAPINGDRYDSETCFTPMNCKKCGMVTSFDGRIRGNTAKNPDATTMPARDPRPPTTAIRIHTRPCCAKS